MMQWTSEQEKAVNGEKANCLVSAAAGSGKTQVLTGRILRRITEEKVDINRILIVTFTNAAAAEMRERITKNLTEYIAAHPTDAHVRRQLSLLTSASIMTMDSFCLRVLRDNFLRAGLDAGFRVADPAEAELLRSEAAAMALEKLYAEGDADFLRFADCYSSAHGDENLCALAMEVYKFAESMPAPMKWLREQAKQYACETPFQTGVYATCIVRSVRRQLTHLVDMCKDGAYRFGESTAFATAFEKDAEALAALAAIDDWDALHYAMNTFVWAKRAAEKSCPCKEEADNYRAIIKRQGTAAFEMIASTAAENAEILQKAYPHAAAVCRLTEVFAETYTELKQAKGLTDYSDLEHFAIDLLSEKDETGVRVPSEIACMLREKYDEIYIDEYQDSNDVQELLFTLISRECVGTPNTFMVGDMKQSVYSFRKTSPALFIQKNETYGEDGNYRRVALTKNFRSREEILAFTNAVFARLMRRDLGGIAYTGDAMLYAGASYPSDDANDVRITYEIADADAANKGRTEAYLIAESVERLLQSQVYDMKKEAYRPAQYADIVIIMRSVKNLVPYLEKEMAKRGIPLFSDVGGGYFETREVTTVLSLLHTLDNPRQDIPLLATLRSPMFRFHEEELAQIRLRDRAAMYYTALERTATEDTELGKKCAAFLGMLRKWRRLAARVPTDELLLRLFDETGYLQFVTATRGGAHKRANLEFLLEKARQFEKTSFRGLFHFLRFVEKVQSSTTDVGEPKSVGETDNVVRLMSIHKSKGLEFPFVILAGTGNEFNRRDTQGNVLLHKDLGLGITYIDPVLKVKYPTPAKTAVALALREEGVAEELRVLYVALTRAKERLVITGALPHFRETAEKWTNTFTPQAIINAKTSLELLVKCYYAFNETEAALASLNVHDAAEETEETYTAQTLQSALPATPEVDAILSYVYPQSGLRIIPSKLSVTELKRIMQAEDGYATPLFRDGNVRKPRFLSAQTIGGAQRGTLMHFVMQTIDFSTVQSVAEVTAHVQTLLQKNILSAEQAAAVDCARIARFLQSDIGRRLRKADKIYREEPFTMTMPASRLTGNTADFSEQVIVQGIIDCYFFEGEKIVLLDYKTDAQTTRETILKQYALQMECYAAALSKKYFLKISEKIIYLFANDDIIVVP